jgi:hypothetical protein
MKIPLTVVGIRGKKKLALRFICGFSKILYDIGLGEFSLTLWTYGRFHNRVNIVKEIALRTSDGHWPKSFVIGDEAEEGHATACEPVADLGRQLQCTCDTIIGEHCEDMLKDLAYYSIFLAGY